MSKVHSGLEPKEFSNSSYAVDKFYCTSTGKIATDACPSRAIGWYKKSNVPGVCTSHSGTVLGTPDEVLAAEKAAEEAAKAEQEAANGENQTTSENGENASAAE